MTATFVERVAPNDDELEYRLIVVINPTATATCETKLIGAFMELLP